MFLVPLVMYIGVVLLLLFCVTQIIAPMYIKDLEMFWAFKKQKTIKKKRRKK